MMEYKTNDKIIKWISKVESSALYESLWGLLVFFGFSILAFTKTENQVYFLLFILGLLFFLAIYIYGGTYRRASIINKTIRLLIISESKIHFETFSYSMLGLRKYNSQIKELGVSDFSPEFASYPILDRTFFENVDCMDLKIQNERYFILIEKTQNSVTSALSKIANDIK